MRRRELLRAAAATALAACAPTTIPGPTGDVSVLEIAAYLCAHDSREPSLTAVAEVLLGERKPAGSLPAVVPARFSIGAGMRVFA
jgi:hypothetical protein